MKTEGSIASYVITRLPDYKDTPAGREDSNVVQFSAVPGVFWKNLHHFCSLWPAPTHCQSRQSVLLEWQTMKTELLIDLCFGLSQQTRRQFRPVRAVAVNPLLC
jgi:hypothetical protein